MIKIPCAIPKGRAQRSVAKLLLSVKQQCGAGFFVLNSQFYQRPLVKVHLDSEHNVNATQKGNPCSGPYRKLYHEFIILTILSYWQSRVYIYIYMRISFFHNLDRTPFPTDLRSSIRI